MNSCHGLPRALYPERSRRKSRGSISLALILAIVIGVAVLGGAGWWAMGQNTTPILPQLTGTPRSGSAPLEVTFTPLFGLYSSPQAAPNFTIEIDFGDGSKQEVHCLDSVASPDNFCTKPPEIKHVYTQAGTFSAALKKTSKTNSVPLDSYTFGTVIVSVTSEKASLNVVKVSEDQQEVTVSYQNMPREAQSLFLCVPSGQCTEWGVEFAPSSPNGTFVMARDPKSSKIIGDGTYTIQAVDFSTGKRYAVSQPFTVGSIKP